ncbi:MAG: GGDEF domain-containing protein [Lachnospiraceae bacterium]|nr:GGDEF domain-containing protein [Lachnospiraceae bacterium]
MSSLFSGVAHIQDVSREYLEAESESIAKQNQGVLCTISVLYTAILVAYNIIVPLKFANWGINFIYRDALIVQICVFIYIFFRHFKKERSFKEVQVTCLIFQLYVMVFVITISVAPPWMPQSAIYFAPIMIGFIPSFIFTWNVTMIVTALESAALIIASYIFKSEEIFSINLFAALLAMFMGIYLSYLVYHFRNSTFVQAELVKEMARKDVLTQIYNRGAVEEKLLHYIKKHSRDRMTLCIVDVDDFKRVNDTMGHAAGDHVLKSVAILLRNVGGDQAIVGRMGGDEFMMFFKKDVRRADVEACLDRVREGMHGIVTGSPDIVVTTSIGAYEKPEGQEVAYETMFQRADEALYIVKKKGKDSFGFYVEHSEEKG